MHIMQKYTFKKNDLMIKHVNIIKQQKIGLNCSIFNICSEDFSISDYFREKNLSEIVRRHNCSY